MRARATQRPRARLAYLVLAAGLAAMSFDGDVGGPDAARAQGPQRTKVPGVAAGIVAANCQEIGLEPCWTTIQEGVEGIEEAYPEVAIRSLYIAPGEYRESVVCAPRKGNTNLLGMGLGNTLIARGTASIAPPRDDGVAPTLTVSGCHVQNLRISVGEDAGDRGIYLTGKPVPEQIISDVTVNGKLGADAVGIDIDFTVGFVSLMNTRVILNCLADANANTAAVRVDIPDGIFTELRFEYGLYELKNAPCPLEASVFDFRSSSRGGGANGTEIFFAQVQCVATTCFEVDSERVNLNLGSIDLRRNQARFFRVNGTGTGSWIYFKGIEAAFDFSEPSIWNNVAPMGMLHFAIPAGTKAAVPSPCFPGWTMTIEAGAPGRTFAVCERGPPDAWAFK